MRTLHSSIQFFVSLSPAFCSAQSVLRHENKKLQRKRLILQYLYLSSLPPQDIFSKYLLAAWGFAPTPPWPPAAGGGAPRATYVIHV